MKGSSFETELKGRTGTWIHNLGTLKRGSRPTGWLLPEAKGTQAPMDEGEGYYRADRWASSGPYLAGPPRTGAVRGGMLDYQYFRNVISRNAICQEYAGSGATAHIVVELSEPLTYLVETVFGATRISHVFASGIHPGIWNFGAGNLIVSTLRPTENLGLDPAAEKLFGYLLRVTLEQLNQCLEALPPDLDGTLKKKHINEIRPTP